MSDLQTKLSAVTPLQQSEYDTTLKKIIDGKGQYQVTGDVVVSSTGDGIGEFILPELPGDMKWQLSPVTGDNRAKLPTTGSSGTTTLQVATEEDPDTNLATLSVANTDGDDTFVNASSVVRTLLPGGQRCLVHVDAAATGAVGPASVELMFRAVNTGTSIAAVSP